jgi:hypothetical protein
LCIEEREMANIEFNNNIEKYPICFIPIAYKMFIKQLITHDDEAYNSI